jgi:hypothetical protein
VFELENNMAQTTTASNKHGIDWNNVIKKEARGNDDDNLGEVQEIGETYVLTQKGVANKKRFYLPKYLVKGYDGHNLIFGLSKEQAKNRFMRDSPPTAEEYSMYKTGRLMESGQDNSTFSSEPTQVPSDIEERVPLIEERRIPETISSESATATAIIDWDNIVHKNVRTSDNRAIGNVAAITDGHIVITSAGARDEFSIPKKHIQGYNGAEVLLDLSMTDAGRYQI